jgi:hypothetical protein
MSSTKRTDRFFVASIGKIHREGSFLIHRNTLNLWWLENASTPSASASSESSTIAEVEFDYAGSRKPPPFSYFLSSVISLSIRSTVLTLVVPTFRKILFGESRFSWTYMKEPFPQVGMLLGPESSVWTQSVDNASLETDKALRQTTFQTADWELSVSAANWSVWHRQSSSTAAGAAMVQHRGHSF